MLLTQRYKESILSNLSESRQSALKITEMIQNSELNAGGPNYTRTLHIPKFFSQEDKKNFQEIVRMTYGIFSKVIDAYRKDPAVRALFGFSKQLEELILLEPDYEIPIPICRIDIFYDEKTKDFQFCEFNTDGTSAMNENKRLNDFLVWNNIYKNDPDHYEILELVESWVDAFLKTCPFVPKHIAIIDFLDKAYLNELYVFEKVFQKRGYSCEVVDIRQLDYREGHLISKKTKKVIDVIYRRAVTRDIMEGMEQVQPFLKAVLDKKVVLIGAFQTQLVHHKVISQVLIHPKMKHYFTKEENEFIQKHLPETYDLTEDKVKWILQQKNHWIIKPKDSYASKGVWAGVDVDDEEWEKVVCESVGKEYIVQRFITPFQSENIDLVHSDSFRFYSNLTGLYVYRGEFAGVYSRLSDAGIISTQYNEKTIPTLFALD